MIDITITDKQMSRGVVHTDQFENGVHVLRFTIDDYMQGATDLRKFKAYVVTSLNGILDIAQIPYTVSGRAMTLTWSISAYTLRNPGVIQYQIRFSESAEDGTAVWYSYKGMLINRLSINADDYMSANYPTLLKQNLDLLQTLSGAFGSEIVYMPVGQSVPIEERLVGRLYYQWLEIPGTRATCATGTVNLGKRPHADSGLYINGVHVFVDDTADEAYVLDPAVWVDAVNAANCGVLATDISSGGEIILLLTAKDAGVSGNNITLKLDLALYGAGANTVNPSGGTVSGARLVGGTNEQTGVTYPTGQFEDAHGNILGHSRAKHLTNPDLNEVLEDGEYICVGTMTNNPISENTYCILHVTDSSSTSRVLQECHCVDLTDHSVRTYVRARMSGSTLGAWRELGCEPIGEVKYFATNQTPVGWLLCDGSAVSRTTYKRLFAAIGTTWGAGDGSETFNLPNLIDRVPWGASTAGTYLEAGLPNITGSIDNVYGGYGSYTSSGAFEKSDVGSETRGGGGGANSNKNISFDAARSSSIYGNSSTVQPPAATLRPCIKY